MGFITGTRDAMPMEVDLHIHSHHSPDSMSRPRDIIRRARRVGLSAIAVTDHNSWEGYREAKEEARGAILIVGGAELRTDKGDLLALFVEEPVPSREWAEAIDQIHSQGGVAVVPHPAASKKLRDEDIRIADAVETFNAKCGKRSNESARGISRRLNIRGIASSDAHSVVAIGNGTTSVPEFGSIDELRASLLRESSISRTETTNPVIHYGNAAFCFAVKGVWAELLRT